MQIHDENDDNDTDENDDIHYSSLNIRHVRYGIDNRLKQIQDFATDLPWPKL